MGYPPIPCPLPPPPRRLREGRGFIPDSLTPEEREAVRSLWPDIVAAAKNEKPMVANALEDAEPASLEGDVVRLWPLGGNPLTSEGLTRNRPVVEAIVGRFLGRPVAVALAAVPAGGERRPAATPSQSAAPPPPRLTASGAKAERLKALRKRDPSLDSAIDSLDLDLLE